MNVPTELERAENQTDSSTMLQLRVTQGEQRDETLRLDRRISTIGAASNCSLRLASETLAPCHCVIVRGTAGVIVRRWSDDTQLNGQSFSEAWLQPGDALQLGQGPDAIELAIDLDEHQPVENQPNESRPVEGNPLQERTSETQPVETEQLGRCADEVQTNALQQVRDSLNAAELREADALRRLQELHADVEQSKLLQAELEKTRAQLVTENKGLVERLNLLQAEHTETVSQLAAVADAESLLEESQLERQQLCDELEQLETQFEALRVIEQRYDQLVLEHSALLEEQQNVELAGREWEQLLESERSTWQAELQAATEANRELQRELDLATTQLCELQQKLDTARNPNFDATGETGSTDELAEANSLNAFAAMTGLDNDATPDFPADEPGGEESLGTSARTDGIESPSDNLADVEFNTEVENHAGQYAKAQDTADLAKVEKEGGAEFAAASLDPAGFDILDECRAEPYTPPRFLSPDDSSDAVDDGLKPVLESQLPLDDGAHCEALHRPATDTIGMLEQSSEALPKRYGRLDDFDTEGQSGLAEAGATDDGSSHAVTESRDEEQTLDQYMACVIGEIRSREVETQSLDRGSLYTRSARTVSSDTADVNELPSHQGQADREPQRDVDESGQTVSEPSQLEASRSVVAMDLAAMRNVANQSARNNIETHDERKNRQSVLALWGITLTLFAVSVGLLWMYRLDTSRSSVLYQAILALVGSLICGIVARVVGGKLIATGTSAREQGEAAND